MSASSSKTFGLATNTTGGGFGLRHNPRRETIMKYLETIAKAYGYSIKKGSSDGYNGYRIFNRHNVSVGVFFDSLDSVAEFFAKKIQSQ